MRSSFRFSRAGAWLAVMALIVGACGGGSSAGPSTQPSADPSGQPSAQPSASGAAFELAVLPIQSVGRTMNAARSVFLVTVSGSAGDPPVTISASAPGATVSVDPASLPPGTVGEVTVVVEQIVAEADLTVTITATRDGVVRTAERTLTLVPENDTLAADAADHLAPFLPWLAASHPELGIDEQTSWQGTPGAWVLIVSHYLYFSEDWELGVEWHVMTPPDDWTRIYLRHRWTETAPSKAFEISSFSAGDDPHEIAPPDAVWR